jgi:O-methyltransferase
MFYGRFDDPASREFLAAAIARFRQIFDSVFAADNVILFNRSLAFRYDRKLIEAGTRNASNAQERSLLLRLNTLAWAASHALRIPGEFVECGVWRGYCSAVVADYLDFDQVAKTFYLYDTFEGIPPEYDSERHDSPLFREEGLYASVVARFARFPNIRIVRGVVPQSFAEALPERVAFLHLDMNSSKSEIAALEVLFDRISAGGVIVFDDYGWLGYQAQQRAEDSFVNARGHRILELPSGQGLLIKQAS